MTYSVRCSCGARLSDTNRDSLIERVRDHARTAHDLDLTEEQIVGMIVTSS